MTSAADFERQARWEMEGVRVAAERYHEAAKTADPTTLPPGSRLLRMTIKPLIPVIAQAQAEGMEAVNAGGRYGHWCWPIQLLPADKLAVLTATVGLRIAMHATGRAATSIPAQAAKLVGAIRDQIEFDRWEAEQTQLKAEAKRLNKEDHDDLLFKLKKRYPTLDRRVWARWRAKLQIMREEPWTEDVVVALGSHLIGLMVKAAPDIYRIDSRPLGGGQVSYSLRITPEAEELLQDLTARAEVARPLLMPMLCKPVPWAYAA